MAHHRFLKPAARLMPIDEVPPQPFKVLIVEDDTQMAASTRSLLEREAFEVAVCPNAEDGLDRVRSQPPDLVVLDVHLPGIDGIEACRQLRTFSDAYIIMLTGLNTPADRVTGLSVGADDYMAKPYSPRELVARIRAMQRRPRAQARAAPIRRFGSLQIDPGGREVKVDDKAIDLSRTEFDLLDVLAAQPRTTLSRQQLLKMVWGENWFGADHVIDVHMSNLRRKLGDHAYIKTVRGYGYKIGEG